MQDRSRVFATVNYQDSAPQDWIAKLESMCVPALISPLHDKDVDSAGNLKKPHHHIMVLFEGCKTISQAKEVFDAVGGVGVEIVKSTKAYARYLCHIDNKDKAQYDPSDVICLSGVCYMDIISQSSDKYSAIGEMVEFCMDTGMNSYAELLLYAKKNRPDWFHVLCDSGTMPIVTFMRSRTWETQNYKSRGKD